MAAAPWSHLLKMDTEGASQLLDLVFELYSGEQWKYALAAVVFNAAEFARTAKHPDPTASVDASYHDRALHLSPRFTLSDSLDEMTTLRSILHCMDGSDITGESQQGCSEDIAIVSVHGYVPQKDDCQSPHIPSLPCVFRQTSALLVICALTNRLISVVPCFEGWPVMPKSLWNKRLVMIQVAYLDEKAVDATTIESQVVNEASQQLETKDVSKRLKAVHTQDEAVTCKEPSSESHTSENLDADKSDSMHLVSEELSQLYCVHASLTTKGIRMQQCGRLVYIVPDNMPELKCSVCNHACPDAIPHLNDLAQKMKQGEVTHLACKPEGFLGCAHCSIQEQTDTLAAWEASTKKVILDHDIASIRQAHADFLQAYDLSDTTMDSFERVAGPGASPNVDKNCEALRFCARWQRGKNASYPTYTFVLVDTPLKSEGKGTNRRVKSGSSAPPWNKVVPNMTLPSDAMVRNNCASTELLMNDCPLYKVPFNAGIEQHVNEIRARGRVRNKHKK